MGRKFQTKKFDSIPVKEEIRLDLDKPEKPEPLEQLLKYLCPGCTQIAFYTRTPNGAFVTDCPACGRSLAPLLPENFVVCTPEEAEIHG